MQTIELFKSFKHKYFNLDCGEFNELINADPTLINNTHGIFCGKYAVWIASQYVKGNIKAGDIPELKAALTTYDKNKSHLKPIKEVRDLTELIDLVKDLSDDFKPSRCISKGEQGLEKVYEDDEWIVYIPHTFEASRKIGGDTHWCTAASNGQDQFNYYSKKGPLYVNVRKSDGEKFQFHFETNQFMDKEDKGIKIKGLGFNDGIIEFYQKIDIIFNYRTKYEVVDKQYNGFYTIKNENNKVNWITPKGILLSPNQWFDCYHWFSCGKASISLNKKWNYINEDGNILLKDWFDFTYDFSNNIGRVYNGCKSNYVNANGNLLSPNQWFDDADNFSENYALVALNGKFNIIDNNGHLISKIWFDYIDMSYLKNDGVAIGTLNGHIYAISIGGDAIPIKKLLSISNKIDDALTKS